MYRVRDTEDGAVFEIDKAQYRYRVYQDQKRVTITFEPFKNKIKMERNADKGFETYLLNHFKAQNCKITNIEVTFTENENEMYVADDELVPTEELEMILTYDVFEQYSNNMEPIRTYNTAYRDKKLDTYSVVSNQKYLTFFRNEWQDEPDDVAKSYGLGWRKIDREFFKFSFRVLHTWNNVKYVSEIL